MNEKQEKFEDDIKKLTGETVLDSPPELFIGQMQCFLCGVETIGLPMISSGWRCLEVEGKKYFVCKKDLPSLFASVESWKMFYRRIIRKIWQKDFNRPIEKLVIYLDNPAQPAAATTPSGTMQTSRANVESGSVEDLLKDVYEQTLPTIMAAFELVAPQGGTTEFTATGDCQVKELDYSIHLKIDFQSFGGVRIEHLPEKERTKAEGFLPPFLTLESLVNGAIILAFNEMNRQNDENMRQAFIASVDNLTFIEGYLYKIVLEYKFQFDADAPPAEGETVFVAPENPHLN